LRPLYRSTEPQWSICPTSSSSRRSFGECETPKIAALFLVHLTPEGKQTQQKAATELAGQAETLLRPLDAAERRQLIDLLTRIADHWEELNATQP
jgi:hypothetical protein